MAAPTIFAEGDQTATVTTEHELPGTDNVDEPGWYVFEVDTSNMAAGDVLELRVKRHLRASDTTVGEFFAMFAGAQDAEQDGIIKSSDPFVCAVGDPEADEAICTLKQTFGTGRVFPWRIVKQA